MICKVCGELIPDSARFCPKCGVKDPDLYGNQKKEEVLASDMSQQPADSSIDTSEPRPSLPTQEVPPASPQQPGPLPYSYGPGAAPQGPAGGQQLPPPPGYAPLPYSSPAPQQGYYAASVPVYQQPKKHTGLIVAVISIAVILFLAVIGLVAFGMIQDVPALQPKADGTEAHPYHVGDTITVTGDHADALFQECEATSEITLKEFLVGVEANAEMVKLGADLSLLDDDEQYALVRFDVKLLNSDSESPVLYSDYDFYIYDYHLGDFCSLSDEDDIYPESIQLTVGQTGEVTIFAVADKDCDLQSIYYTQNGYVCFSK